MEAATIVDDRPFARKAAAVDRAHTAALDAARNHADAHPDHRLTLGIRQDLYQAVCLDCHFLSSFAIKERRS